MCLFCSTCIHGGHAEMHRWWVVLSGGCNVGWELEGWACLGLVTTRPTHVFSSMADSGYAIRQLLTQ